MPEELQGAFASTLEMFRASILKFRDEDWRRGTDDYKAPVRIAFHIIVGLEWLVTDVPTVEHRTTRRYNLNWLRPVEGMPSRTEMLRTRKR